MLVTYNLLKLFRLMHLYAHYADIIFA